jgi:hypothetical protein
MNARMNPIDSMNETNEKSYLKARFC